MDTVVAKDKIDWTSFETNFRAESVRKNAETQRVVFVEGMPQFELRSKVGLIDTIKDRHFCVQMMEFWNRWAQPCLYNVSHTTFRAIARVMCHPMMLARPEIDGVLQKIWEREASLLQRLRSDTHDVDRACEELLAQRRAFCAQLDGSLQAAGAAPAERQTHTFLRTGPCATLHCVDGPVEVHETALAPYNEKITKNSWLISQASRQVVELFVAYAERRLDRLPVPMHLVADLAVFCRNVGAQELYGALIDALPSDQLMILVVRLSKDRLLQQVVAERVRDGAVTPNDLAKSPAEFLDPLLALADGTQVWGQIVATWIREHVDFDARSHQNIVRVLAAHAYLLDGSPYGELHRVSWQTLEAVVLQKEVVLKHQSLVEIVRKRIDAGTVQFTLDSVDVYLNLHSWTEDQFVELFGPNGGYRQMLTAGRRQAWMQWYQQSGKGNPPAHRLALRSVPAEPQKVGAAPEDAQRVVHDAASTQRLVEEMGLLAKRTVRTLSEDDCRAQLISVVELWRRADLQKLTDEHYRSLLELGYRVAWISGAQSADLAGCARLYLEAAQQRAKAAAKTKWEIDNQQRMVEVEGMIGANQHRLQERQRALISVEVATGFWDWNNHIKTHGTFVLPVKDADEGVHAEEGVRIDPRMLPAEVLQKLQAVSPRYPRAAVEDALNHYAGIGLAGGAAPVVLATLWGELGCVDKLVELAREAIKQRLDAQEMVRWLAAVQDHVILKRFEFGLALALGAPKSAVRLEGVTAAQMQRIVHTMVVLLNQGAWLGEKDIWTTLELAYRQRAVGGPQIELLTEWMNFIRWESCKDTFYAQFGVRGVYAAVLSDEDRERWSMFLGGHGSRPLELPARVHLDYRRLNAIVLEVEGGSAQDVRDLVPTGGITWDGVGRTGTVPVTGEWYGAAIGPYAFSVRAIWLQREQEIQVYFRGTIQSSAKDPKWTSYTFGGQLINCFIIDCTREDGVRVARFSNVSKPANGIFHTVQIELGNR